MLPASGAYVKVTLLGHATVLVETGPMRILMDPVLQDPFENGMVVSCPKRVIDLDRLGPIDVASFRTVIPTTSIFPLSIGSRATARSCARTIPCSSMRSRLWASST